MATYKDIQSDIRQRHGRSIKTCWIAHVKELNGLPVRNAPNRMSSSIRQEPCPTDFRPLIEESMHRLGMLKEQIKT